MEASHHTLSVPNSCSHKQSHSHSNFILTPTVDMAKCGGIMLLHCSLSKRIFISIDTNRSMKLAIKWWAKIVTCAWIKSAFIIHLSFSVAKFEINDAKLISIHPSIYLLMPLLLLLLVLLPLPVSDCQPVFPPVCICMCVFYSTPIE